MVGYLGGLFETKVKAGETHSLGTFTAENLNLSGLESYVFWTATLPCKGSVRISCDDMQSFYWHNHVRVYNKAGTLVWDSGEFGYSVNYPTFSYDAVLSESGCQIKIEGDAGDMPYSGTGSYFRNISIRFDLV